MNSFLARCKNSNFAVQLHLKIRTFFRSIDSFYYPLNFHSSFSVQDSPIMNHSKTHFKQKTKPLFNSDSRLQELFGNLNT